VERRKSDAHDRAMKSGEKFAFTAIVVFGEAVDCGGTEGCATAKNVVRAVLFVGRVFEENE
jgi:ribosomal protein S5